MKRFCFMMELRPGAEEEYVRRHQEVWPELISALQDAGVRNYTLFLRGQQVIAYAECEPDGETAFGKVAETKIDAIWSKWFEDLIGTRVTGSAKPLTAEEIWHLD
jgi:L-rhamnose mutarotase